MMQSKSKQELKLQQRIEWATQLFGVIQKEANGTVDAAGFECILYAVGVTPTAEQLEQCLGSSRCKSNRFTLEDVLPLLEIPTVVVSPETELKSAFSVLDADQTETVQFAKLKSLLAECGDGITEKQLKRIIRKKEINKAGKFSYGITIKRVQNLLKKKKYDVDLFDRTKQGERDSRIDQFIESLGAVNNNEANEEIEMNGAD